MGKHKTTRSFWTVSSCTGHHASCRSRLGSCCARRVALKDFRAASASRKSIAWAQSILASWLHPRTSGPTTASMPTLQGSMTVQSAVAAAKMVLSSLCRRSILDLGSWLRRNRIWLPQGWHTIACRWGDCTPAQVGTQLFTILLWAVVLELGAVIEVREWDARVGEPDIS